MQPKRRIIPIFVPHVGCPNDCVFCNQRKISGVLVPASARSVACQVENALSVIPEAMPAEIAFYGGSFTAIPQEEQEALLIAVSPFLHTKRIDNIRASTRPDCIKKDKLLRLKELGLTTIELGTQSMDNDVLKLSNRGHSAEDTMESAAIIKSCGLGLVLQMMTGLPGDTPEKSIKTAKRIADLKPDAVRIYPTVIIKDTMLYDMWQDGKYKEHTVGEAVELCSEIVPIFRERNIPIIRLGLNPTDELSDGEAVAGAYHPAFGELVYSRIYRKKAENLMDVISGGKVLLAVAKGKLSLMIGQKRCNILYLTEKYGLRELKVCEDNIKDDEVVLLKVEK